MRRWIASVREYFIQVSLRGRLLAIFVCLLTISTIAVGTFSYIKAKDVAITTVEDRLVREVEVMEYIADNLKFMYVSDEDYFMQQLEINVRSQQQKLSDDQLESEIFYITAEKVIPFQVSQETLPTIPDTVKDEIIDNERGIIHTKIDSQSYTLVSQPIDEIDGIYTLAVPTNSYMTTVNQMALFTIAMVLIAIIVSSFILFFFVQSFTKPLTTLRESMRKVRDGNFQEADEIQTTVPEVNSLQKSFNAMLQYMKTTIHKIQSATDNMEQAGRKLENSSNLSMTTNENLVHSIQAVRLGAEQTASSSENGMDSFQAMKHKISDMIESMDQVFTSAGEMNDSAELGAKQMTTLMTTIRSFEEDFEHLTTTIQHVQKSSDSIHELIGLIQGISEQTKLLSLNASIEAARAGDSGAGFAVVANEVGKLAEQSSQVAEQITTSISSMQDMTMSATGEFEQMLDKTRTTLNISNESKQSIDELMTEIDDVNEELHQVKRDLEQFKEMIPGLEHDMESFLSVSQETLASAEEMLTSSDSQEKQIKDTSNLGLKVKRISESLSDYVKQFQVK